MMESVYLQGSEDVRRASATIASAASEMQRAAGSIEDALFRHRQFLDEWIGRFEAVVEKLTVPR